MRSTAAAKRAPEPPPEARDFLDTLAEMLADAVLRDERRDEDQSNATNVD